MAEKEEFKTFDYLKFPLAALVVYLHGHITNTTVRRYICSLPYKF